MTRDSSRLLATIKSAAPGVTDLKVGTQGVSSTVVVIPASEQTNAQATIDSFDWSDAAQAVWQAGLDRTNSKAVLDNTEIPGRIQRAMIFLTVSELNLIRGWIESFKAATAAATTLADLKTRVAALAAMPDRTNPQVITAIKAAIDSNT